jgi:hypothetical protein
MSPGCPAQAGYDEARHQVPAGATAAGREPGADGETAGEMMGEMTGEMTRDEGTKDAGFADRAAGRGQGDSG